MKYSIKNKNFLLQELKNLRDTLQFGDEKEQEISNELDDIITDLGKYWKVEKS